MDIEGIPNAGDIAKIGDTGSKIMDSIGGLFPGIRARSVAKAESRTTEAMLEDLKKIKASQNDIGLSDDSMAFLMSDAVRRHGRYENFNAVLTLAEPLISENADASKVDRDWAEHFRDHAEKAVDDDVRRTWAAILAGEINNPGTFSKRTLSILADMSKAEVNAFMVFCSSSARMIDFENASQSLVFVVTEDENGGTLNDGTFSYEMQMQLESLGLIDSNLSSIVKMNPGGRQAFLVGDHIQLVECISNTKFDLFFSPVLTTYGRELSMLCEENIVKNIDTLFAKKILKQHSFSVSTVLDVSKINKLIHVSQ